MNDSWKNPAKVEKLRALWLAGWSGGAIAAELHVSRNAVIGKAHRLGLALAHGKRSTIYRTQRTPIVPAIRAEPRTKLARFIGKGRRARVALILDGRPLRALPDDLKRTDLKKLDDLEDNHCRYVIGDPQLNPACWCGRERVEGLSYCADHVAVCYLAVAPTRKAAPVLTKEDA